MATYVPRYDGITMKSRENIGGMRKNEYYLWKKDDELRRGAYII
jgi:hypothetical protein